MNQTIILPTGKLIVGMIVHAHGSRFELIERNTTDPRNKGDDGFGAFITRYLGPTVEAGPDRMEHHEAIPAHWRTTERPWIIQGNNLASWAVEA